MPNLNYDVKTSMTGILNEGYSLLFPELFIILFAAYKPFVLIVSSQARHILGDFDVALIR